MVSNAIIKCYLGRLTNFQTTTHVDITNVSICIIETVNGWWIATTRNWAHNKTLFYLCPESHAGRCFLNSVSPNGVTSTHFLFSYSKCSRVRNFRKANSLSCTNAIRRHLALFRHTRAIQFLNAHIVYCKYRRGSSMVIVKLRSELNFTCKNVSDRCQL